MQEQDKEGSGERKLRGSEWGRGGENISSYRKRENLPTDKSRVSHLTLYDLTSTAWLDTWWIFGASTIEATLSSLHKTCFTIC